MKVVLVRSKTIIPDIKQCGVPYAAVLRMRRPDLLVRPYPAYARYGILFFLFKITENVRHLDRCSLFLQT